MRELLGRLSVVDAGAESAVRVIAFFDSLTDAHAGLDALLRGAAALADAPVGLLSPTRHLRIRVGPDGHRLADPTGGPDPAWPTVDLHDGQTVVWIERAVAVSTDTMVLERFAAAVLPVLDRTRGRAPVADPELVEVVLDRQADPHTRAVAARRLGLPPGGLQVQAVLGTMPTAGPPHWQVQIGAITAGILSAGAPPPDGVRWGLGPTVGAAELWRSWQAAVVALRLTANGTHREPGPTGLRYDELGPLALLAESISAEQALVPDVRVLLTIRDQWPWGLATVVGLCGSGSLRQAATELSVHHSTLQERLGPLQAVLGYDPSTPHGRHRLYLSLQLYRLQVNGHLP